MEITAGDDFLGVCDQKRFQQTCVLVWTGDQLVLRKKKFPSIYRKQITHLQSDNQTDMELRNRIVGLRQQVQHSHHAEIPNQNSQSRSKSTPVCNKSYSTYRLQHPLRK